MVTNEAISRMNAGMRTLSGMMPFSAETVKLEHMSTIIVARPIDMPVIADEVVPKVGQRPRISTNVGLRLNRPSIITLRDFIFYKIEKPVGHG